MKILILITLFTLSVSAIAANRCPDEKLTNKGWLVDGVAGVTTISDLQKKRVSKDPSNFSEPAVYNMYSTVARRWVELTLIDDFSTPQDEMYGDILWIRDNQSKEVLEVRWYDNKKIHVNYDKTLQPCATDLVPFVDNSLY